MAKEDSEGKNGENNSGKDKNNGGEITVYEWIVAALGCVFVFGSVAFMTYKAVTATDKPPDLTASVKSVERLKSGYLVRFEIKNDGEFAAAGAVIKGELKKDGKTEEESTTTVDYVPSFSTRSGGIFFSKDPRQYSVEVRATGYTEP